MILYIGDPLTDSEKFLADKEREGLELNDLPKFEQPYLVTEMVLETNPPILLWSTNDCFVYLKGCLIFTISGKALKMFQLTFFLQVFICKKTFYEIKDENFKVRMVLERWRLNLIK